MEFTSNGAEGNSEEGARSSSTATAIVPKPFVIGVSLGCSCSKALGTIFFL